MNGRSQMQGGKNYIFAERDKYKPVPIRLIGWKSGKITYVPPWDRMEGAWLYGLW
jgi:hypothetical protein